MHPVDDPLESHIKPTCVSSGLKMAFQHPERVEGDDRVFTQRLRLAEGDICESRNAQARWMCIWQLAYRILYICGHLRKRERSKHPWDEEWWTTNKETIWRLCQSPPYIRMEIDGLGAQSSATVLRDAIKVIYAL